MTAFFLSGKHKIRLIKLLRNASIDRAVVYAVLGNIVSLILGPITALLIATHFSPELQGYYYAFGSLSIFQFLIELGLGQAIIQFASHEWSKLEMDKFGYITGSPDALSRLISLGRQSLKWYAIIAIVVAMLLSLAGLLFFSNSPSNGIQWAGPWLVLCLGIGVNLVIMPLFYLLQGCNQVSQFWFFRLIQQIINGFGTWVLIWLGAKLWVIPIAMAFSLTWSFAFLIRNYTHFVGSFFRSPSTQAVISWRTEVWPIQWRIAISWVSSYFAPQMFVPVLFSFAGPVVAGQMGMTAPTLGNVLLAISSNWVVTKAPRFGMLIAQRKFLELDQLFFRSFFVSLIVACVSAGFAWGAIGLLSVYYPSLASRVLPLLPAGLFFAASVVSSAIISLATYLRAHKEEPLAGVFFGSSTILVILTIILGGQFHAVGVASGYLAVLIVFQIPLTLYIFRRRRADWHRV